MTRHARGKVSERGMGYKERHRIPDLGVGVGFRLPHYSKILEEHPPMDWFEVISENFMVRGGKPLQNLDKLRAHYPVINHGVSLSIGASAPLDRAYLLRLKELVKRIDPPWCSDHLCWGGTSTVAIHDLLPLPHTKEVVKHVAERVRQVQDTLERPFALENVSSYLAYAASTMAEWEMLAEIAEKGDCGILLDCNNIYVSARNHGFDPNEYVDAMPVDRVVQMHLAGHTDKGTYLLDTHSDHVRDEVWTLYRRAIARCGATSTLIEWDEDIPSFEVLASEAQMAREARDEALGKRPRSEPRDVIVARGEASCAT
jgi:uncharacterized protein (UPF0276 family)